MDNERRIFPSSAKVTETRRISPQHDWPWNTIDCGQSFAVRLDEIKKQTLRPLCSLKGQELKKKFKMVVHDDCYEVARVK